MHHICFREVDFGDAALTFETLVGEMKTQRFLSRGFSAFVYLQELEDVFSHWPKLRELDLCGNPVCKTRKYRDHLITVCKCLGEYYSLI